MDRKFITRKVGELVTFNKIYKGTFKVLKVEEVPPDQIEYDPVHQTGGVGHHQWLLIDSPDHKTPISGWFFEPESETA